MNGNVEIHVLFVKLTATVVLNLTLCGRDLPRPMAMVLPLYSKLIVQFQELVEILHIKYPLAY